MDLHFVALLAVLASLGALFVAARRAITIAELVIRRGVVRVERGGIAPSVLADLGDVARSPALDGVRVRITRSGGRAETVISGPISDAQAQRIRNVIGSVPFARLINARRRVP